MWRRMAPESSAIGKPRSPAARSRIELSGEGSENGGWSVGVCTLQQPAGFSLSRTGFYFYFFTGETDYRKISVIF